MTHASVIPIGHYENDQITLVATPDFIKCPENFGFNSILQQHAILLLNTSSSSLPNTYRDYKTWILKAEKRKRAVVNLKTDDDAGIRLWFVFFFILNKRSGTNCN